MKPGSFDPDTSKEMVGHERSQKIEEKARKDADADNYDPPRSNGSTTYWGQAQAAFEFSVYNAQYSRRKAKMQRQDAVSFDPKLVTIAIDVIARSEKAVNEYKSGKEKALNSIVGMLIGEAKKQQLQVDAATVNTLLKEKLQG